MSITIEDTTLLKSMIQYDGGHIGFSTCMKNAQGWQCATHLDIIIEVPNMNNQQRKKLYQTILGSGKIVALVAGL